MIEARALNGSLSLHGTPADGSIVYVDADWLPRAGGPAAAIVVSPDGNVCWPGRARGRGLTRGSPEAAVGLVLDSLASAAADAVRDLSPRLVRVPGRGLVAAWVRARLGAEGTWPDGSDASPQVVVDTTADAESVLAATRRVQDLGTVVLAGGLGAGTVSLDFYPDVHVRGLRIVGVTPSLEDVVTRPADEAETLAEAIRKAQRPVRSGEPLPAGALLYRVEA